MDNIYIIIPAFEPERCLERRVKEMREKIPARIVVVDDGSGEEYEKTFERIQMLAYCTVLRHEKNRGKGRALKTAFRYVLEQIRQKDFGSDTDENVRILCADCDGQHLPEDGVRLLGMSELFPGSLILGVRCFSGNDVPWKSKAGNRISSILFRVLSGRYLSDTQTGFRAFNSGLLGIMLQVPGERFEYETAVLMACAKKGIPFQTVRIETVYEEKNAGTHFRPAADSFRVMSVLFREPAGFMLSSLFCAALDISLFWMFERAFAGGQLQRIVLATAAARLFSAAVNFTVNRNLVFCQERVRNRSKICREALLYLMLCVCLSSVSALGVFVFSVFAGCEPAVVKIPWDMILFFLSYLIQKKKIFSSRKDGAEYV